MFVGDDSDYTKNAQCDGGPYLVFGDPDSYVKVDYTLSPHTVTAQDLWKYGVEVFCNKQGRYTTIVADLNSIVNRNPSAQYEVSLCHLGIMGTQYERSAPVETDVSLLIDDEYTILVQPISAKITIGNTLDINLR